VAVSGTRAYRLLEHVLAELEPHLPEGVHIEITPHRRWTTVQRSADAGPVTADGADLSPSSYSIGVRALGTGLPVFPLDIRRRLAAQDAVETLLDVAYANLGSRTHDAPDMLVRAATHADGVLVSYTAPERPTDRVELGPIPFALL
jgi:hypothetical protein